MSLQPANRRADAFWQIAATPNAPDLGPGPRRGVLPQRELEARLELFSADHQLEADAALRLRAAALLYHDHHDPAHDIVQELNDVDAAIIHAILHRREPDYWNAKYWFRRFDVHPIYLALGQSIQGLVRNAEQAELARKLTLSGSFESFAFVDCCEAAERLPALDATASWLKEVQDLEFHELVSHLLER